MKRILTFIIFSWFISLSVNGQIPAALNLNTLNGSTDKTIVPAVDRVANITVDEVKSSAEKVFCQQVSNGVGSNTGLAVVSTDSTLTYTSVGHSLSPGGGGDYRYQYLLVNQETKVDYVACAGI